LVIVLLILGMNCKSPAKSEPCPGDEDLYEIYYERIGISKEKAKEYSDPRYMTIYLFFFGGQFAGDYEVEMINLFKFKMKGAIKIPKNESKSVAPHCIYVSDAAHDDPNDPYGYRLVGYKIIFHNLRTGREYVPDTLARNSFTDLEGAKMLKFRKNCQGDITNDY
jgi:hypothetical protein